MSGVKKDMYDGEDWAEFLKEIGFQPENTESAAREVARHAVKRIEALEDINAGLEAAIDSLGADNYSLQENDNGM